MSHEGESKLFCYEKFGAKRVDSEGGWPPTGMAEAEATSLHQASSRRMPQMKISFIGACVTSDPKDSRDHAYIENLSAALLNAHPSFEVFNRPGQLRLRLSWRRRHATPRHAPFTSPTKAQPPPAREQAITNGKQDGWSLPAYFALTNPPGHAFTSELVFYP